MTPTQFLPGDRVLTHKALFFEHPIISLGDGWFIEKAKTGEVRRRHASDFPLGTSFMLQYRPRTIQETTSVVRRAEQRIGFERYDAISANCQHFVNEVYTGMPRSEQVEEFKAVAVVGLLLTAFVAMLSG